MTSESSEIPTDIVTEEPSLVEPEPEEMAPENLCKLLQPQVSLDGSRYDMDTYKGRLLHFMEVCDPRLAFASTAQLFAARQLIRRYKSGTPVNVTAEELWKAKRLYQSAFHPDTGELVFLPARMAFQMPANMVILGCALTFYNYAPALISIVCFNQAFNAMVNYYNRNATAVANNTEFIVAFLAATFIGTLVAISTRRYIDMHPNLRAGMAGRFIPMCAGTSANCVNVPLMRQNELNNGIKVFDDDGKEIGLSQTAARLAIFQTLLSRIAMAAPAAVLSPIIMSFIERKVPFIGARRHLILPIQVSLVGFCFAFCTPMACALFSQKQRIALSKLEPSLSQQLSAQLSPDKELPEFVWFNKGL